ncbi:MAG: MFS transporter [Firmicutes bacterium]|nr:MFS transporter [Bacillota bacterium]
MAEWRLESATAESPKAVPWSLSIVLAAAMFVVGADLNIVAPLLIPIAVSFHRPVASTGFLVTVFALSYTVASPFLGWLQDRGGFRRAMLFAGLAGFILTEVWSASAHRYSGLLVARALGGMTAAAISPTAYALIGDHVPYRWRARAMAVASMGFSTATIAGVPLGLLLAQWWGWRGVMWGLGGLAVLAGIALVPVVGRLKDQAPAESRGEPPSRWGWDAKGLAVLGASFAAFAVVGLVYTYLSSELRLGFAWTPAAVARLLGAYGLLGLGGNWLIGWWGDRVGKAQAVQGAMLAEVASLLAMGLALWAGQRLAFLVALMGFALFQAYIPNLKAMASQVERRARGRSMAWNNAAMYGGLMAGSALGARLWPAWGFAGLTWAAAAVAALGVAVLSRKAREGGRRVGPAAS